MTTRPRRLLTGRDLEILTALDRTPLSAGQLHVLSRSFARGFGSERMARERLAALCSAGWVQSGRYATIGPGAGQNYYQLARTGYRILYGERAEPPTKRYFVPISLPRQHHTRCLADFIVHTIVAAHDAGITFTDFYRENTLRLSVGTECLYPDCAFRLILPDGRTFNYLVEIDNHTEQIRSTKDADSWQKKSRLYDDLQSASPNRFRVLVVTTRSGTRLKTILALAAAHASNSQRSILLGTPLATYLAEPTALAAPVFLDHHLRPVSLLTGHASWKVSTSHIRRPASEAPAAQ
jgi:hypothetical protein